MSEKNYETLHAMYGQPVSLSTHVRSGDLLDNSPRQICNLLTEWVTQLSASMLADEGWDVFNQPRASDMAYPVAWLQTGVERDDSAGVFVGDEDADQRVMLMAPTSRAHRAALEVHLLCNALRHLCWGKDYVASRCGPDYDELTPEQLTAVQELTVARRGPMTPVGMPGW